MGKLLDDTGLKTLWDKIKNNFVKKTDYATASTYGIVKIGSRLSISSGVLSSNLQTDNNFTNAYKNKIDGVADYVVDEGTLPTVYDGQTFTWHYKKWNNGTMELWVVCGKMVPDASWQPWGSGGWYYYDYPPFYFPIYFLSGTVPNVQVTANGVVVLPTTTSVTRDHATIRIVRVSSPGETIQINMSIYAFGKW